MGLPSDGTAAGCVLEHHLNLVENGAVTFHFPKVVSEMTGACDTGQFLLDDHNFAAPIMHLNNKPASPTDDLTVSTGP